MIQLPRPRLLGGAIEMVAAPPSPEQEAAVATLVRRAERIRNGGVNPREDNMLAITTDGRKVALDMRVLNPDVGDFAASKVNLLVERVLTIWTEARAARLTQLIFCDLSKPVAPGRGFSVYNDVREKLIARGVPPAEISFIHDAGNDVRKACLFADVRAGRVRILMGSTQKMGLGTNVQDRLYAVHHLDGPWRPADIEQRDGRMMRRGNTNPMRPHPSLRDAADVRCLHVAGFGVQGLLSFHAPHCVNDCPPFHPALSCISRPLPCCTTVVLCVIRVTYRLHTPRACLI